MSNVRLLTDELSTLYGYRGQQQHSHEINSRQLVASASCVSPRPHSPSPSLHSPRPYTPSAIPPYAALVPTTTALELQAFHCLRPPPSRGAPPLPCLLVYFPYFALR